MASISNIEDNNLPQWKKDLIMRRRTVGQVKCLPAGKQGQVQLSCPVALNQSFPVPSTSKARVPSPQFEGNWSRDVGVTVDHPAESVHQPSTTTSSTKAAATAAVGVSCSNVADVSRCAVISECNNNPIEMVRASGNVLYAKQQKMTVMNGDFCNKNDIDSDSSEEFQYGPGIVNKLKSKYLSLTLREVTVKSRPSILRRATSLENILDDDASEDKQDAVERKFIPRDKAAVTVGRYRNASRGKESMKRARSVETLLRYNCVNERPKLVSASERNSVNNISKESLNEDVFIIEKEGNDKPQRKSDNNGVVDNNLQPSFDSKPVFGFGRTTTTMQKNKPKRIAPLLNETERPPADLVKTTLRKFETTANKKPRGHKPVGEVAVKVDKFKTIIEQEKKPTKPGLKPKPLLDKNRKHITKPPLSPKFHDSLSDRSISPHKTCESAHHTSSPIQIEEPVKCTIETIKPEEELPVRPDVSRIAELFERSSSTDLDSRESLMSTPTGFSPIPPIRSPTHSHKTGFYSFEVHSSRESSKCSSPAAQATLHSPVTPPVSPVKSNVVVAENSLLKTEQHSLKLKAPPIPTRTNITCEIAKPVPEETDKNDEPVLLSQRFTSSESEDEADGEVSKLITKTALQNIEKAGTTINFNFDTNKKNKTYLPVIDKSNAHSSSEIEIPIVSESLPEVIKQQIPPVPPPRTVDTSHKSITNGASNKSELKNVENGAKNIPLLEPLRIITQPPKPNNKKKDVFQNGGGESSGLIIPANNQLTSQEIEKNLINREKTLEQPVSKVIVSVKSVQDVVIKSGDKGPSKRLYDYSKPNSQQNTIVFDFRNREGVPDHVENDGYIRKGKREKPKAGEGGVTLLPGVTQDESDDWEDNWMDNLKGPPSPCNVVFENDNILIDGRSSISRNPKQVKLKIQFNDSATETYEYPSETSLMDDTIVTSSPTTTPNGVGSKNAPLDILFANYKPSKVTLTPESFELGVTRSAQPPPLPPRNSSPGPTSYEQPDYCKPANDVDNVAWSSETVADLLF